MKYPKPTIRIRPLDETRFILDNIHKLNIIQYKHENRFIKSF
jgi:hypothetical protein